MAQRRHAPILGAVPNQDRGPTRPFAAGRPQAPISGRSASGLVLPGISSTAWMLGLTPVHELNAWLANLARSYLIAREYLEPAEAARGRVFNRDDWITVLLALHPQDEYLHQLAALNHAACRRDLVDAYQDRFPQQLPRVDAQAVRAALSGVIDGQPRSCWRARRCCARCGSCWYRRNPAGYPIRLLPRSWLASARKRRRSCWSIWRPTRSLRKYGPPSRGWA